jgi:NDP-sugar pyrophosphorylase family protein
VLPVAVLCGGLGTRLRPLTDTVPKAMVLVAGEPFIAHLLRLLASRGVTDVVLCVSHLGELIERFVGNGSRFRLTARYSYDGPQRVGTAGAVRRALPLLGDRFLLTYGDSYLPIPYVPIETAFVRSGKSMLMTVWQNRGVLAPSNVAMQDGRIVAYRKGTSDPAFTYVDYGVGAYARAPFDELADNVAADLSEITHRLIAANDIATFEVFEPFYEIGSPKGLAAMENYLRTRPHPPEKEQS